MQKLVGGKEEVSGGYTGFIDFSDRRHPFGLPSNALAGISDALNYFILVFGQDRCNGSHVGLRIIRTPRPIAAEEESRPFRREFQLLLRKL